MHLELGVFQQLLPLLHAPHQLLCAGRSHVPGFELTCGSRVWVGVCSLRSWGAGTIGLRVRGLRPCTGC